MRAVNFSRNLCTLRRERKITQEKLAEVCGVSRQAVTKWESGSSLPDLYKLSDIAEVLDVTTDELLFGEKVDETEAMLQKMQDMLTEHSNRVVEFEKQIADRVVNQVFTKHDDEKKGGYMSDEDFVSLSLVHDVLHGKLHREDWLSEAEEYACCGEYVADDDDIDGAIGIWEIGLVCGSMDCGALLLKNTGIKLETLEDNYFWKDSYDGEYFAEARFRLMLIKGYVKLMEMICDIREKNKEINEGVYTPETFHKYLEAYLEDHGWVFSEENEAFFNR